MNPESYRNIQVRFNQLFTGNSILVRSPGRINLIGEHTDYNYGFVLPAAIDKEIVFCMGVSGSNSCNLYSQDLQQDCSFELDQLSRSPLNWANYLIGVILQLQEKGYQVPGFNCVFGGDIPLGAGMSSSAALECGLAYGLDLIAGLGLSRIEIARLSQAAENQFVGMQCGLMDQYANMFGQERHLILMDCRDQTHQTIPVDLKNFGLWLFNSKVTHEHSSSEYNVRRQECEAGVRIIQASYPMVKSLRDCNLSMLSSIDDSVIRGRCRFVIEENLRVTEGSEDLRSGALKAFGEKMYLSHQGLSKQYQVSCPELDLLVDYTRDQETVLGARMMGGGFGGCTINLIRKDAADSLISGFCRQYHKDTGREMEAYPVKVADGTSPVSIEELTRNLDQ